jgi:hypothetical protein
MNNKLLITHSSLLITSPNISPPRPFVLSCPRAVVLSFPRSFVLFLDSLSLAVTAQIQPPGYRAEFGSILQAGNMKPFWMISNQDGKFQPDNSSLFGGIYIGSEVERQDDFFADSVGNFSDRLERSDRYERTDRLTLDYGLEVFNRYASRV